MQQVMDFCNQYLVFIVAGLAAVTLISFILAIVAIAKASKMKKKYLEFMKDSDGKSIERLITSNLEDIAGLRTDSEKATDAIKDIYGKLANCYCKAGLVKYDAYNEMGGKLSFALTLLDKRDNGFILNVMHSNTGCFAYIKEVVTGQTYIELGKEEADSLKRALAGKWGDVDLSPAVNDEIQKDKM